MKPLRPFRLNPFFIPAAVLTLVAIMVFVHPKPTTREALDTEFDAPVARVYALDDLEVVRVDRDGVAASPDGTLCYILDGNIDCGRAIPEEDIP